MKCHYWCLVCLWAALNVQAEFDPETLSQSTVRVQVKDKGRLVSVASGFVWKTPSQVVTSLHVMHDSPNSQIIIEFGKKRRKAKVKAVLMEADLVLLEVSRPIKEWRPLEDFEGKKPPYKTRITALGYHHGALGMSTRELLKGYAKPEILQQLLPPQAVAILQQTNMPSVTLPIYYLDGSLLPGYSGAPVVDLRGRLIGIGNGGLENGAANVSWVIPASFLTALEQSNKASLPNKMAQKSQLFSLDRRTITPKKTQLQSPKKRHDNNPFNWFFASAVASPLWEKDHDFSPFGVDYQEVTYQQFRFIKVKQRRYAQMIASSGTPKLLNHVLTIFSHFFPDISIDYQNQLFDVYTDPHYGLNIVVPAGAELITDDGFLLAKGQGLCRTCAFEIQYHARLLSEERQLRVVKTPMRFLNDIADQHWEELNQEGDYDEYSQLRQIERAGSYRYVLRAVFSDFLEPFKDKFELNYYSAAISRNAWFQAQGIINPFTVSFVRQIKRNKGLNCQQAMLSRLQHDFCRQVLTAFHVLTSTHLTSFSNRIFTPEPLILNP